MQKITPYLWFDKEAEEAARLYTSLFKNSRIKSIARYGEGAPAPKGSVMTVAFELDGQDFIAGYRGRSFRPSRARCFRTRTRKGRAG